MFSKADIATPLNPKAVGAGGVSPKPAASIGHPSPFKSTFEAPCWNEVPSRESTLESTVASEGDHRIPPVWSPDIPARLSRVREQRGWRYFLRHTLRVPLVFISGLLIGVLITSALLISSGLIVGSAQPYALPPDANVKVGFLRPYPPVLPPKVVPPSYMESQAFNNSCLIKNLVIPDGPQTFDACAFVIRSTDEVWNVRGDVDSAIEKYFHEEYLNSGSWGRRGIGKKELRDAILAEMRAFPDIKIHITDCVCKGNDNDGYKCAMPDVLTGTNLGPSSYGPPTGRYARWTGLVESLVKRDPLTGQWQYYAEWGVHDEWSLIQQLGLDFSRVPHPMINNEPLHDCTPLVKFSPAPTIDNDDLRDQERH